MEITKKIKFKHSDQILTFTAKDFMYEGYPYIMCEINGICLNDCSEGQKFQFQTSGVFTLNINDEIIRAKPGEIIIGDRLYYVRDISKNIVYLFILSSVENIERLVSKTLNIREFYRKQFGIIISEVHPISKRFDFMLVQGEI